MSDVDAGSVIGEAGIPSNEALYNPNYRPTGAPAVNHVECDPLPQPAGQPWQQAQQPAMQQPGQQAQQPAVQQPWQPAAQQPGQQPGQEAQPPTAQQSWQQAQQAPQPWQQPPAPAPDPTAPPPTRTHSVAPPGMG